MFALLIFIVFWGVVIRMWIMDGPKVPLIFITIWVAGYFGFPIFGLSGYAFMGLEGILVLVLIIIERYNEIM